MLPILQRQISIKKPEDLLITLLCVIGLRSEFQICCASACTQRGAQFTMTQFRPQQWQSHVVGRALSVMRGKRRRFSPGL